MASKIDIGNSIIRAYNYAIQLTDELADEHDKGCLDCVDASNIECLLWLSEVLQDRSDRDVLDKDTDALYEQLLEATSAYYGDDNIDPNASIPYTIINVSGGGSGIAAWGFITGDINQQSDLIAKFDTKVDKGQSIYVTDDKAADAKYDNDGNGWGSVAQVQDPDDGLPVEYRYAGLTLNIAGIEYWFPANVTDLSLAPVIKSIPSTGMSDGLIMGGNIDISDFNIGNISVDAAQWLLTISGSQQLYSTSTTTLFTGIALSTAGNQRYVAFFGNGSNAIIKVEGAQSPAAVLPNTPANTILLGYVLITDAGADTPVVDLTGYVKYTDIASDSELETQTTPVEDKKIVSVHGLIYWWNWLRTQAISFTNTVSIFKGVFGSTAAANAHITTAPANNTTASLNLKPSSDEYTGDEAGAITNILGELKFNDGEQQVRLIKTLSNELFSGVGNRVFMTNEQGDVYASVPAMSKWVYNTDVLDAIAAATWTDDRADITPANSQIMYKGQQHDDGTYTYEAIANNRVRRW